MLFPYSQKWSVQDLYHVLLNGLNLPLVSNDKHTWFSNKEHRHICIKGVIAIGKVNFVLQEYTLPLATKMLLIQKYCTAFYDWLWLKNSVVC